MNARELHEAGVKRLNELFAYDARYATPQAKHSRPESRRLARKRARAARRLNRVSA